MSKATTTNDKQTTTTASASPAKAPAKKFGKKLEMGVPYAKVYAGQVICGVLTRKVVINEKGKFPKFDADGVFIPRKVLEIAVFEPCLAVKKKAEVTVAEGETVRVDVKAGLSAAWDLDIGTEVRIEVTGKTPTDKGNDAWTYDVQYNEADESGADN